MSPATIIRPNTPPLQVGVSACLLGKSVRYDGGHKRHEAICAELADIFHLVAVCPEGEAGFGVPRPPVRLVERQDGIHALGVEDLGLDVTNELNQFATQRCESYAHVCGFILKARSPSCGFGSTPINGLDCEQRLGDGLFAAALRRRWPNMPIVQEDQIDNPAQRNEFIAAVQAYARQSKQK